MFGDVEVANAEREVDRVDVFERRRRETAGARARRPARGRAESRTDHWTGRSRSASFRLPRRYPCRSIVDVLVAERAQLAHQMIARLPARAHAPFRPWQSRAAPACRGGARGTRGTPARAARLSACSIVRSFSSVTSLPYGMRDDRHAEAGTSQVGSPARATAAGSRPSSDSASSSGLRTPYSRAACRPGRSRRDRRRCCHRPRRRSRARRASVARCAYSSCLQ